MTTPFSSAPASYAGATPAGPIAWPSRSSNVWLGVPGQMIQLPPVTQDSLAAPPSRGEIVHGLHGGGAAVTVMPSVTRSWTLNWPSLIGREWQVIHAFHRWSFGAPPWCLVMQEDVNKLTFDQSMCSGTGWAPTGTGTITASTAVSAYVTPSGVMKWSPSAASVQLVAGSVTSGTPTPNTSYCAPNVAGESFGLAIYARAVSASAQVAARVTGCNADGSSADALTGSTVTVSASTWSQVPVIGSPGRWSAPYLLPSVVSIDGSAVYLCNARTFYASAVPDWELGSGVPRVIPSGAPTRDLSFYPSSATTWTFAEAITGAA